MGAKKKDGSARKSTKGMPRITAAVLAMTAEAQQAWIAGLKVVGSDKPLSEAQKSEAQARLTKALAKPSKGGAKVIDWPTLFAGRSSEELTVANTALNSALASAKSTLETEIAELQARMEQKVIALRASKAASEVAPAQA